MFGLMSAQDKMCSDIYQTLVEIYAVPLNFSLDMCQIKVGIVLVSTKSVLRCLTVITCFVHRTNTDTNLVETNGKITELLDSKCSGQIQN